MPEGYDIDSIIQDVINKTPDMKNALQENGKPPIDPNAGLSNRGARNVGELVSQRWTPTAIGAGNQNQTYVTPEFRTGRRTMSENPAERIDQEKQLRAIKEKARSFYDPKGVMSEDDINSLAKAIYADPEEEKWLNDRTSVTQTSALDALGNIAEFVFLGDNKSLSPQEILDREKKTQERTSGERLNQIFNKERAYLTMKKRAIYNDLGAENVQAVLKTKAEQKSLIESAQKANERLNDPSLLPEERASIEKYLNEVVPSKQEKLDKELSRLGDKVDQIRSFEEYDQESIELQQAKAKYLEQYPEFKNRMNSPVKKFAMDVLANPKLKKGTATELTRQAFNVGATALGTVANINENINDFIYDLNAGIQASDPNRDWFEKYILDAGVSGVTSMATIYALSTIGAGSRMAAAEKSGSKLGEYMTNLVRNPANYLIGLSSYNQAYYETLEEGMRKGLSNDKAHTSAKAYGLISAMANVLPENIFDEVKMFKGLSGKDYMKMLGEGKDITFTDMLKNAAKINGAELTEEYLTTAAETLGRLATNAIAATDVFEDVLPTASELLETFTGTMIAGGAMNAMTGGFDMRKQAMIDLANDPVLAMKGFDNLVNTGTYTPEQIEPMKNEMMNLTAIKQQFPHAKGEDVLAYYELDNQFKRAQDLFTANSSSPMAAQPHAVAMQAIEQQKNELIQKIGVDDLTARLVKQQEAAAAKAAKAANATSQEKTDVNTENKPLTPEQAVVQNQAAVTQAKEKAQQQGVSQDVAKAAQFLEGNVNNTSEEVLKYGLGPAMITQLNAETQKLKDDNTILNQQYNERQKEEGNEEAEVLKAQIDQNTQKIAENEQIVNGIKELNLAGTKTEEGSARAATLLDEDTNTGETPSVEAATAKMQEAISTAEKTKGSALTGQEVVSQPDFQTAVASFKEDGYTPTEAINEIKKMPAFENMTVKDMNSIEDFVKGAIPANNNRETAAKAKAEKQQKQVARKKAAAVQDKTTKENKPGQKTKVERPTEVSPETGLQDREAVAEAEAYFAEQGVDAPTKKDIDNFVDNLVKEKRISKTRARAVRSRLKSFYGTNTARAEQTFLDEDFGPEPVEQSNVENETGVEQIDEQQSVEETAPSIEMFDNEQEEVDAFLEAESGDFDRVGFGEITPEKVALLEARNALSGNWADYLKEYNASLQQRPDGTYYLPDAAIKRLLDVVIGKAVDGINKKYKSNIKLEDRDANGYFPDETNPIHSALNDIIATLNEESQPDVETRNFANTTQQTARLYLSGQRSIENEVKLAIDAIARKFGLTGFSSLEEMQSIEEAAEEITDVLEDGDDILANIIDKNRGDKSTRAAESISKLVDYVYKQKIKAIDGAAETGLIHSHAFISSIIRKNNGDIVKTIGYIQARLSSKRYPITDLTTKYMMESIGEVLYELQDQMYNNATNIHGHAGNPFTTVFLNNSLKSVFSSHVMKHNAVAINRAGLMSMFVANQSKIRRDLTVEMSKGISDMLSDIINTPELRTRLLDIRNRLTSLKRDPDTDMIQSALADLADLMSENQKLVDFFYNTNMKLLQKASVSKKSKREAIDFLLALTSPSSEIEKQPMYQFAIGDYISRNERIFGNFAESKWRSLALKQNQSAIQKDNRVLSTAEKVRENALISQINNPDGNDASPENNVVLNSDDRIYGSGERKELLSKNPLVALKSIASKYAIRQLSEFSIAKGKTIAVKAEKLMREHIVLGKMASLMQTVKYDLSGYQFINQITDSPRIYQINGARVIKTANGYAFHGSVKTDQNPIQDYLLPEAQRAINAALGINPNLSIEEMRLKLPTFFDIKKSGEQYVVSYSEEKLNEQAKTEFRHYVEARVAEYFNPAISTNVVAAESAKNMIVDAAMAFYTKQNLKEAQDAFKKAVASIEANSNVEVNSGLKSFAKSFAKDEVVNVKQGVQKTMKEFVVNEEFNRYYAAQFIRGGQEYFMSKDSDDLFVRSKMFDSPGIPVSVDMPFRYVIMDKNLYGGTDTVPVEIVDSKGNKISLSANPGDGVMFISEKANINIASTVGPQLGYIDQYKYSMATVNEAGQPTGHKAMQIVLTKELAENNPMLMKLYNYMRDNNLDAILDNSAEKIGAEARVSVNWNENSEMPTAEGFVHTANYSDIFVQLPVNRLEKTGFYSRPEQEIRQTPLLSDASNQKLVDEIFEAVSNKIGGSMFEAMKFSSEFLSLIRNYREAYNKENREEFALKIIQKLNEMKTGRSAAEQTFFDSIIEKIRGGYTFEYDDGLLYNMQSSKFKEYIKNKMEGVYASLLSPLAVKNAPKFRIDDKANSEVILPARFEAALERFKDASGDVYITGIKVPYNNAGTQLRARVIFDSSLDKNGASVVVPNEYYALSNSDNDGDHLFVFPMDPYKQDYIDIFKQIGVDLKSNPSVDSVVAKINEAASKSEDPRREFSRLMDRYRDYQDAVVSEASAKLFQTGFGNDMQLQVNDVKTFDNAVQKLGYSAKKKHTLSSTGQLERREEIAQSTGGIGTAASMINVLLTTFKAGDKMRVALRRPGAKTTLFKIGKKVFDPAVLEVAPAVTQGGQTVAVSPSQTELLENAMPGITLGAKRNFMNGTSQLLQLFVDSAKKGYMAKIGLNEKNVNAFNYLVARLSISTSQEVAFETAINFINQPIIKKYFDLQRYNPLLKDEFAGNNFALFEQLKNDLVSRNPEAASAFEDDIADISFMMNQYSDKHVQSLDYTKNIDLVSSNNNYAVAQAEALKMLQALEEINGVVSQLSVNRKKFENIPTNIEEARTFMLDVENMGLMASDRDMKTITKMIDRGNTLEQIKNKFAFYKKKGWTAGIKNDTKSGPATALNTIKMYKEAIEQETYAQTAEPVTELYKTYMAYGLSKEGVRFYLENMSKIYAQEVITGNKQLLEDPIYFAKARAFFMNMAYVGDNLAAYKPNLVKKLYNTVSSFIRPQSKRAFSAAVSRFQEDYNREVMKSEIDGWLSINGGMTDEVKNNFTKGLSTLLDVIYNNKTLISKNGFVRNLEVEMYDNIAADIIKSEKGLPVYRNEYFVTKAGGYTTVQAKPFVPKEGTVEEFQKAIQENPVRAFEIALNEALKSMPKVSITFNEQEQKLFNSIDGTQFEGGDFGVTRKAANTSNLENQRVTGAENNALQSMAISVFNTIEGSPSSDAYSQWIQAIKSYLEANTTERLSPRFTNPQSPKVMLSKNGRTDFEKAELEDIAEGISQLFDALNSGNFVETIRTQIEKAFEKNGISNEFLSRELLTDPLTWVRYFADQMPYSKSRNLLNIIDDYRSDAIKNNMNATYEDTAEFDNYTKKVIYNNPTITPFYDAEYIASLEGDSQQAINFGARHEYFHTREVEEFPDNATGGVKKVETVKLYKRIQAGYIQTAAGKNGIKSPNYKFVEVGRYNMRDGEVAISTNTDTVKVNSFEQLAEIIDNMAVNEGYTNADIYDAVKAMIYGIGDKEIDTTEILRSIASANNENNWGWMISMNNKDFIAEMVKRFNVAISEFGPQDEAAKRELQAIKQGLEIIQDVSIAADKKEFIISNPRLYTESGASVTYETKRYKGRMLLRGQINAQAKPSRLPILDVVRNLLSYTQTGQGSIRTKTIGEYVKAQSKTKKAPKNLSDIINIFQSGYNGSPLINQVAQLMNSRVGATPINLLSSKDFYDQARTVFPNNPNASKIAAFYYNGEIYLNEGSRSIDAPELILHEALHAFTYHAMTDPDNADLHETMLEIRQEIVNAISTYNMGNNTGKHAYAAGVLNSILTDINLSDLEQMEEVISYVLSDRTGELQSFLLEQRSTSEKLANYRGEGNGLFGTIKNFLSNLLSRFMNKIGFNSDADSIFEVLTNTMDAYSDRFATDAVRAQGYSSIDSLLNNIKGTSDENAFNQMAVSYGMGRQEAIDAINNAIGINQQFSEVIGHMFLGAPAGVSSSMIGNMMLRYGLTNSMKTNIENATHAAKSYIDVYLAGRNESIHTPMLSQPITSTALEMTIDPGIMTITENGTVNFAATVLNFGQSNRNPQSAIEVSDSTMISNLNIEQQKELIKAAFRAYLMEQAGYDVGEIRLFTAEVGPQITGTSVKAFTLDELRPLVKNIITEKVIENHNNSAYTSPVTMREYLSGQNDNYSTYYMRKMSQEMPNPNTLVDEKGNIVSSKLKDYEQKLIRSTSALQAKLAVKSYVDSYKTIYEFVKNGNVHDLTTKDLYALLGEIKQLQLKIGGDQMNSFAQGLADMLLLEEQGRTIKRNAEIAKEAGVSDNWDWQRAITHSLNQLNPKLGISGIISDIQKAIDTGKSELYDWQSDFEKKAFAVTSEKHRFGGKLINKVANRYRTFPSWTNKAFENLYDKTGQNTGEVHLQLKFKSLNAAAAEVANGTMTQNEYALLKHIVAFMAKNHSVIYNTKGVNHGGMMDEGKVIHDKDLFDKQYFVPYYPAGTNHHLEGLSGARKFFASMRAYLNKSLPVVNPMLHKVQISKYTFKDGSVAENLTVEDIMRKAEIMSREKNGFRMTEQDITDLFELAKKNSKTKQDVTPSESAKNSMALPGFIRTKQDYFNPNLFDTMMSFSREVHVAKVFAESRGAYVAAAAVAEEADKKGMARFLETDMQTRVLKRKYAQKPISWRGTVVSTINTATRLARLGLNKTGAQIDFIATTIVHMDRFSGFNKEEQMGAWSKVLGYIPPVNYAFAVSKILTYGKTIYRIAVETGMLNHSDMQYGNKSLLSDVKFGMNLPFWLSGNMPRLIALADKFSIADLQAMKENKRIIKAEKPNIQKAIDEVEASFGKFRESTERLYMANDYLQGLMMFKSWMPDLIWSRFGGAYEVNGRVFEGKYRTAARALFKGKKPEGMTTEDFNDSIKAAIWGIGINAASYAILTDWAKEFLKGDDDDNEEDDLTTIEFIERVVSQINPLNWNNLLYTAKGAVPPLMYLYDVLQTAMFATYAITGDERGKYQYNGKYGYKGDQKVVGKAIGIAPGAPAWRDIYKDKRKAEFENSGSDSGFDMNFDMDMSGMDY